MKLLEAWTAKGEYIVCDGRCYNPRDEKPVICRCICQGMNHASGWRNATDRTKANAAKWVAERDAQLPDDNKIVRWTVAGSVTSHLKKEFMWDDPRFYYSVSKRAARLARNGNAA